MTRSFKNNVQKNKQQRSIGGSLELGEIVNRN